MLRQEDSTGVDFSRTNRGHPGTGNIFELKRCGNPRRGQIVVLLTSNRREYDEITIAHVSEIAIGVILCGCGRHMGGQDS